jgi:hypothetical protein
MSSVSPADSSVEFLRKKVRRLTASPSSSTLSEESLDSAINRFYTQDFIASVKTDQLRKIYEFFTSENVDRYKLNINIYQSSRTPVYIEGRKSSFYKRRDQFFNVFPRQYQVSTPATGDGTTTSFSFKLSGTPLLSKNVIISSKDSSGNQIQVDDEGGDGGISSNLRLITTDVSNGNKTYTNVGTINYVTGDVSIEFPVAPGSGEAINAKVSPYTTGFPHSVLFWNNEFTVRPVPDGVYKVEVETYKTPEEFVSSSDTPELQQWTQYLAYGAALEITRDRGDVEGIAELMEGFKRQENLVLEHQANAEIGVENATIFNTPSCYGWRNYDGWGYW